MAQELIKHGHEVTIFASSFSHNRREEFINYEHNEYCKIEKLNGIEFVWIKTRSYSNGIQRILNALDYYKNVKKAVKNFAFSSPDVVIGSTVHLLAPILAQKLSKEFNAKFYFEERDFWPQTLVDFKIISKFNPITIALYKIEKRLYEKADKIIVLFDRAENYLKKRDVKLDKVIYLPNGIAEMEIEYNNDIDVTLKKYGNKKKIIYTGAHGQANDLMRILELAYKMKNNSEIVFLFYGNGPLKDKLIKERNKLELKNVQFYPPVEKKFIPYLLSKADLAIISIKDSPLYNFGFSMNKIYDYLFAGLPIIMLVNKNLAPNFDRDGIFVSEDIKKQINNINLLIENSSYYNEQSEAAKFYSKNFLWSNQIIKLIKSMDKEDR